MHCPLKIDEEILTTGSLLLGLSLELGLILNIIICITTQSLSLNMGNRYFKIVDAIVSALGSSTKPSR